jgi:hypothetical protein
MASPYPYRKGCEGAFIVRHIHVPATAKSEGNVSVTTLIDGITGAGIDVRRVVRDLVGK